MTGAPHLSPELLGDLAAGSLGDGERDTAARHLAGCPRCRAELDDAGRLVCVSRCTLALVPAGER